MCLPGKLPAPYNSREVFVEIWERESAPAKLLPDIPAIDDGRLESEYGAQIVGG